MANILNETQEANLLSYAEEMLWGQWENLDNFHGGWGLAEKARNMGLPKVADRIEELTREGLATAAANEQAKEEAYNDCISAGATLHQMFRDMGNDFAENANVPQEFIVRTYEKMEVRS